MAANPVVIACAADAGYALPLAVMLRSAAKRLDAAHELRVYAVDGGLEPEQRTRIACALADRGTIRWVRPRRAPFVGLPLWGRMLAATYDKLAIASLLPDDVERALWLDADLLVEADLAALWRLDLGGAVLRAASDARVPTVGARFGIRAHAAYGLAAGDAYFNAGVLLIDLARWRAERVEERALDYLRRHGADVYFWDQEGLNVALAGRWQPLPASWNATPDPGHRQAIAGGDARIVHFSGNLKPWRYAGDGPLHARYYAALDETAWSGWRPPAGFWSSGIARYESSALRRLALPVEHLALTLLRAATFRYASPDDLGIAPDGAPETATPP